MFKNYYCTTVQDTEIQLINLRYGYQAIILTIEIFGGEQDGVLTLNKYQNENLIFTQDLNIGIKQPIALSHKILIPQNFKFKVRSNINGIRVCLNVVYETNDSADNENILNEINTSSFSSESNSTI